MAKLRSPEFGVPDVDGVLELVLPGQAATQPLDHAVGHDLQVAPPAGIWSKSNQINCICIALNHKTVSKGFTGQIVMGQT